MRTGQGFDCHRLIDGRPLILGGVNIPYEKGLLGHSDADVLLHAVCDSLLGAAALRDIGYHFPDVDARYKGICSMELLKLTDGKLYAAGYGIVNIDATVLAEEPYLSPYVEQMRQNIAKCLGIDIEMVSVKATTAEKMGFVGNKEGIAALCVCLIKQNK